MLLTGHACSCSAGYRLPCTLPQNPRLKYSSCPPYTINRLVVVGSARRTHPARKLQPFVRTFRRYKVLKTMKCTYVSCVIAAKLWCHVCVERVKHVLGLDLAFSPAKVFTTICAGRAGRRLRGTVGRRAPPEDVTMRRRSCREALRRLAERAGNTRRLRRYPS